MRLTIWTKSSPARVKANLSSVLTPHVPVTIADDYHVPSDTTVILALGGEALRYLQAEKIIPKNRTTTSFRTLPQIVNGIPVLVSYSPDIGDIDHGYYVDLLTDVSLALRFCQTGSWAPVYGEYRYVQDFSELCAGIEIQHMETGLPVDVTKDLETLGLDPYAEPTLTFPGAYIVTIQATYQKGKADVIRFENREHAKERLQDPVLREQINFLLNCPYIRLKGANFKYDLHWLWKHGGFTCKSFVFDTTIVGSLLDENRSNSLDTHAKLYTQNLGGYADVFNKTVDKSRMDKVPPNKLLPYAGGDVDADLHVAETQKQQLLRDPALTSFYVNILHPAARAFEWVEQGGVLVDLEAYKELKADLEAEHIRLVKEACKIVGGRIVAKHGYLSLSQPGAMNLTKASMICDFLFSPMGLNLKPLMFTPKPDKDGIKRPSTAMEHLEVFAELPEAKAFVDIVREDSGITKTLNTYVVGFLKHLRSDGRYHPTYYLFVGDKEEEEGGAITGRLSCRAPAFQCMVGETEVLTQEGYLRLDELVECGGWGHKVKTHTGEWQEVMGVYRNGRQPVYRITTVLGKQVTCTGNHPILTPTGWVRTDAITRESVILTHRLTEADGAAIRESGGQDVWSLDGLRETGDEFARDVDLHLQLQSVARGQGRELEVRQHHNLRVLVGREEGHARGHQRQENADVSVVGRHEDSVPQSEVHGVEVLRWEGDSRLRAMDVLPALLGRHGGNAKRLLAGTERCEWGLRTEQLHLDSSIRTKSEQEEFQEEQVLCIEQLGWRDTFDLTIENSHSFIANGVVVHNTVPKHTFWTPRIRRCYPAPPGYVIVERDYGQGELRVVACIADETNMIAVFKAGRDIHADTAAPFSGFTYESLMALEHTDPHTFEETRQLGKAGNFGLVFGMREDGFVTYARVNYGVTLEREEAREFRDGYFQKYPRLETYHTNAIQFAQKHKHIRTPLGRIRHLPLIKSPVREVAAKAERQAINSPVQGTLTDMTLWVIAQEHQSGLSKIAPCWGACHDSILNYVPEDKVDEIVPQQLEQMENLPFEKVNWKPQLTFVADAKVGKNWGTLTKFQR